MDIKIGDEIEWENCNGEIFIGTVTEVDEFSVFVDFFKGDFIDHDEVHVSEITKVNNEQY